MSLILYDSHVCAYGAGRKPNSLMLQRNSSKVLTPQLGCLGGGGVNCLEEEEARRQKRSKSGGEGGHQPGPLEGGPVAKVSHVASEVLVLEDESARGNESRVGPERKQG